MRSFVLIMVSGLFVLPAFAQAPKPAPTPTPSAAPKAESPKPTASGSPAKAATARNQVLGTVVSVDEAKATITFKDPKEQTATWKVEGKAVGRLKSLKAGDKVKILYSVDDKGAPKAAVAIKPATKAKKAPDTAT